MLPILNATIGCSGSTCKKTLTQKSNARGQAPAACRDWSRAGSGRQVQGPASRTCSMVLEQHPTPHDVQAILLSCHHLSHGDLLAQSQLKIKMKYMQSIPNKRKCALKSYRIPL